MRKAEVSYNEEGMKMSSSSKVDFYSSLACHCWIRFPAQACGWVMVAHPRLVVFFGYSNFLHNVWPTNANIWALENAFISLLSFLCNLSKMKFQLFSVRKRALMPYCICVQWRPRSDCIFSSMVKAFVALIFTESLDAVECIDGCSACMDVQADVCLFCCRLA